MCSPTLLREELKHLKPFFHERTDAFWFDALSAPIKDQLITAALCAYPILGTEEAKNLGREQLADLLFVVSPKQVFLPELRVRIEVFLYADALRVASWSCRSTRM